MKTVKPIFFHGTKKENIEKILDDSFVRTSYGCYGKGVYCASTIKTALEKSYGNAVLGIQVYGLEKYMAMPVNKLLKWAIFTEDIPSKFIKSVVIFDKNQQQINLEEDKKGLLWIYAPEPDEIAFPYLCNEISNITFKYFNSQYLPKPRLDKIKVTRPYSIEIDDSTPSLEQVLNNKKDYFSDYFQTKSWNYSYQESS